MTLSIKRLWLPALVVLLVALGEHSMAAAAEKPVLNVSSAAVTLDVYSGRPNPTWPLSASMTAELVRRLGALTTSSADVADFDGLGYRAVQAELVGDPKGTVVIASRGVVTLDQAGQRFRYADPGRQFELWLVNTGADHLPSDLLQYVTKEIASKAQ